MAKEKETKKVDVTMDNIEEVINNGRVITEDIAKAAAEELAKQRNEKLTNETIEIYKQSEYTKLRTFLSAKKSKKVSDVKMNYLKKMTELHTDLGSGKVSLDDFRKKLAEEQNTANKLLRDIETWYSEKIDALDNQFPNCWSWSLRRYVI